MRVHRREPAHLGRVQKHSVNAADIQGDPGFFAGVPVAHREEERPRFYPEPLRHLVTFDEVNILVVTHCGCICLRHKKNQLQRGLCRQAVGIKEVHDDIWLVSSMDYDLGYFHLDTRVLEPLTTRSARGCYL